MTQGARKPRCFVIMPFGERTSVDGKTVKFDEVYEYLIKNTLENLGAECVRCDEIDEAGWIHRKMFEHVYNADVAVVDITQLNPNVFYELGVRHTVADRVTVLIRQAGTDIPFNIAGLSVIEYDTADLKSVEVAKQEITNYVRNGLEQRIPDSPVREVLDLEVAKQPKEITRKDWFAYAVRGVDRATVGVVTGDLLDVRGVDVWVSSENTNMEMARFYDRSISGVIRFHGAKRDRQGRVVDDVVADQLNTVVDGFQVPSGHVVATTAGELERTNGVRRVFHAAAVYGQVGKGYTPISDVAACVRKALDLADDDDFAELGLTSMLFPLMGTGTGRGDVEATAKALIRAAIDRLTGTPSGCIRHVWFIASTEEARDACRRVLDQAADVTAT